MTIQSDDQRMMVLLFQICDDMILQKWCIEKNADDTYNSTVLYERSVCDIENCNWVCDIENCNWVCDIENCNVVNDCNNMQCYLCSKVALT